MLTDELWPHRLARELGHTIAHLDNRIPVGEWLRWIALFIAEDERAAEAAEKAKRGR